MKRTTNKQDMKNITPKQSNVSNTSTTHSVAAILSGLTFATERLISEIKLDDVEYRRFLIYMDHIESGKMREYKDFSVTDIYGRSYNLSINPSDYVYVIQEIGGGDMSDFTDFMNVDD